MTHRLIRSAALALAAVTSAAVLVACGGDDDAAQPAAGVAPDAAFNAADVTFAQQMIPHHAQAVEMAELAATRAQDPAVKKLAAKIAAAQGPEIETMQNLLEAWGQPPAPEMEGADHSAMSSEEMATMPADMPGMVAEDEMAALAAAKGAKFDRMFLALMIEHHRGALLMAKTEGAQGKNQEALSLAERMKAAQAAEIKKMQRMKKA
jgi:uncharacterized protein (DUF305 family)